MKLALSSNMSVNPVAVMIADGPNEPLIITLELEQGTAEVLDRNVMALFALIFVPLPSMTLPSAVTFVERENGELTCVRPCSTSDAGQLEKSALDATLRTVTLTNAPVRFTHRAEVIEVNCRL